jgi:hypothetical protein
MGVHLAAEGLKVEGFFGRHSNLEYRAFQIDPPGSASGDREDRSFADTPGAESDSSSFLTHMLKHLLNNLRTSTLGALRAL